MFANAADLQRIRYFSANSVDDVIDDVSTPITSRWRSGWFDFGSPQVKRIRETKIWGSGAITMKHSKDFEQTFRTSHPVVMTPDLAWGDGTDATNLWGDGTDPENLWPGGGQVTPALDRHAIRGTVFSMEIGNSVESGTWSMHRLDHHVADLRVPTVAKADV